MFRQLFWMSVGATGALYSRHKVITTVERYVPARVVSSGKRMASSAIREVKAAGQESKAAMKEREQELRATYLEDRSPTPEEPQP